MAVTKNHPINSTLKSNTVYLQSLKRQTERCLSTLTAARLKLPILSLNGQEKAKDNSKESHLARHFIQAFEPGETTPEQAHEIGKN